MLELKGSAAGSAPVAAQVARLAAAAGIADSVVLWYNLRVPPAPWSALPIPLPSLQGWRLRRAIARAAAFARASQRADSSVLLGLAIPDSAPLVPPTPGAPSSAAVPAATQLLGGAAAPDIAAFDVIAPSVRLPAPVLAAFAAQPVLAWVVDAPEQLDKCLRLGLTGVITNAPLRTTAAAAAAARRPGGVCSGRAAL
ncbi:MAG: hypothetical protein J3K34DRAFT_429290 [Monoraphidium minutum]|nr:MAG: hypothetical protein J3K34DRAFT_429290 [Monoraphidium minutum]